MAAELGLGAVLLLPLAKALVWVKDRVRKR